MPATTRILIVDDNDAVRSLFARILESAGHSVVTCEDGLQALGVARREELSLVVLDVDMPRLDGWKTLAELRQRGFTPPILMVTHTNDVDSRIRGLDAGADGYVGKPCTAPELLERVAAILRRASPSRAVSRRICLGDVVIDLERKVARRDLTPLRLTRTEYALLDVFWEHGGDPVAREVLIERLWGNEAADSHSLDTHLWRLRKKIGDTGDRPRWIRNLPGRGYTLGLEDRAAS